MKKVKNGCWMRQFNSNYIGENWDNAAGAIDYNFVEYVKNNNYDLYNYFDTHADYIAEKTGKKGDLYHFAATMTAFYYWSNYDNGTGVIETVEYQFMPDVILDDLAGWAGDLQTAMVDAVFAVGKNADYNTYKEAMIDLIACEDRNKVYEKYPELEKNKDKNSDIHFKLNDYYADIDAANLIKYMITNNCLEEALVEYFAKNYKIRITEFKNGFTTKWTFSKCVELYTSITVLK